MGHKHLISSKKQKRDYKLEAQWMLNNEADTEEKISNKRLFFGCQNDKKMSNMRGYETSKI